ncbi:Na(+)/H(+) antiporter subunit C [Propioniciclava flava]|uniref:Na(+)/H(+) antiporter subunit C n=1 Tax=Propioniciclava flava TaxID=2072026 RepID=A0A4Q2EG66_9ACTN|nr:Na(+)/H(+) antiporter subunit C [Propioniciclava flava]RXW31993.1 Na(+)/H(+) antiporter subunit C [Propioniciclava flava]
MTGNVTLAIVAGVLIAAGVYLLTERSLTRILVGVLVMSNGVNILFLIAAGRAGDPPLLGLFNPDTMADPLPMAMVLTAIVITMAVSAFVVTVAYRSFQLNGHDEVSDDIEDRRIRELAERDDVSDSFEDISFSDTGEDRVSE